MSGTLISIIVPMLNEREIVDEALTHLSRIVDELDADWEVVVVDAGSKDGTREKAEAYCARPRWKFHCAESAPRSIGGTISVGVRATGGATLLVLPADTSVTTEGLRELRSAVERGARCGGFPKRYVPSTPLLRVYAAIQNLFRFRLLRNTVWTNGIFFPRETSVPTVGFLEDVILSDGLKGPGWVALRSPIAVSARRYYPNHTLRRIFINLSIMILYRLRFAGPARLRNLYVALLFALFSCFAPARPLNFTIVTGYFGGKAGVCGSTPVSRRAASDGKTCELGFFTAAHCFPFDTEKRSAPFRYIVIGENLKRKLKIGPGKADIVFGPEYRGDKKTSRDDNAVLFFSAPCEYLAENELSRIALVPLHVGDVIATVNRKGEDVSARLSGAAETHDQWQARLEGKASIEHGDSGSPLWNKLGDVVGALSRKVTAGSATAPFALSFDPKGVDWARLVIEARKR